MSPKIKKRSVRIIGVALAGRDGAPVVVFDDPVKGEFLPVSTNPFDAEIIIRAFSGEGHHTAVTWLGEILERNPPRSGVVEIDDDGDPAVIFGKDRHLPLGEGLALVHHLSIPLYANETLFEISSSELSFLTESYAFSGDFLYLTPPQYAPNIPIE